MKALPNILYSGENENNLSVAFYEVAKYNFQHEDFNSCRTNINLSIQSFKEESSIPLWKLKYLSILNHLELADIDQAQIEYLQLSIPSNGDYSEVLQLGVRIAKKLDAGSLKKFYTTLKSSMSDEKSFEAVYALGNIERLLGDPKKALQSYHKAFELQPSQKKPDPTFLTAYKVLLAEEGDFDVLQKVISEKTQSEINVENSEDKAFEIISKFATLEKPDSEALNEIIEKVYDLRETEYPNNSGNGDIERILDIIEIKCLLALGQFVEANDMASTSTSKSHPNIAVLKAEALIEGGINIPLGQRLIKHNIDWFDNNFENLNTEWERLREEDSHWKYFKAFVFLNKPNPTEKENEFVQTWMSNSGEFGEEFAEPFHLHLSALVARKNGNRAQEGNHYYEIGKWHLKKLDNAKAVEYFGLADQTTNVEDDQFPYLFAEALYYDSTLNHPPYRDESKIDLAINHLNRPNRKSIVRPDQYYYLDTIGFIYEAKGNCQLELRNEMYWHSALNGERAFVLSQNYFSWSSLARFYRLCGMYRQALYCGQKACALNSDNLFSLEEITLAEMELGLWDEAEKHISRLIEIEDKPYYRAWIGFIKYNQGHIVEAKDIFERSLIEHPTDLWIMSMLLNTYWRLDDPKLENLANTLLEFREDFSYQNELFAFSWAQFCLQQYDEALLNFDTVYRLNGESPHGLNEIFLTQIARSKFGSAEETFEKILKESIFLRSLEELYQDAAHLMKKNDIQDHNWLPRLQNKIKSISTDRLDPILELNTELRRFKEGDNIRTLQSLLLCQARMLAEQGSFIEGIQTYTQAAIVPGSFPQIQHAISYQLSQIRDIGSFWKWKDALDQDKDKFEKICASNKWDEQNTKVLNGLVQRSSAEVKPLSPTPIVLTLNSSILPSGTYEDWPLLQQMIPDMRTSIMDEIGWEIPGVLIRENTFSKSEEYSFSIHEVILKTGQAEKDQYDDLIKSLRQFLIEEIHSFVTIDETIRYVLRMDTDTGVAYDFLLGEPAILKQFTKLLETLIKHNISVNQFSTIFNAFRKYQDDGVQVRDMLPKIRRTIKSDLPGNRLGLKNLYLTSELEELILKNMDTHVGGDYLALSPQDTQDLLAELAILISDKPTEWQSLWIQDERIYLALQFLIDWEKRPLYVMIKGEEL